MALDRRLLLLLLNLLVCLLHLLDRQRRHSDWEMLRGEVLNHPGSGRRRLGRRIRVDTATGVRRVRRWRSRRVRVRRRR